ncbi:MAG: sulfite exporter TauE/SafE family protein [Candidatus Cloacimonetes bacterium]|nr:sulfite exporter TauE/SafE family protein [Candidatus Cloacimonadota bacterium]
MILLGMLFFIGIIAGFINTLAGGGSALMIPVLIVAGVPSPIANATNRVAILLQNAVGSYEFKRHNLLKVNSILHVTLAAIIGAIVGSITAVNISTELYDKLLAVVFVVILILILKPHKTRSYLTSKLPKWLEFIIFLIVGFYGGMIQVGVGFIFLATLNLIEELDLIQANAIKVFIIMSYTVFSVIVFAISGKIIWKYGIVMALGNILGAYIGVKAAIKNGEKFVKIILTIAILIACIKLFGFFSFIGIN